MEYSLRAAPHPLSDGDFHRGGSLEVDPQDWILSSQPTYLYALERSRQRDAPISPSQKQFNICPIPLEPNLKAPHAPPPGEINGAARPSGQREGPTETWVLSSTSDGASSGWGNQRHLAPCSSGHATPSSSTHGGCVPSRKSRPLETPAREGSFAQCKPGGLQLRRQGMLML